MSQAKDLFPPIDATVEQENITFDFGPALASGVTLTGTPAVTCAVYSGSDPSASSRVLNAPQLTSSPNTGLANQAVIVTVGQMIGGVTYRLQCSVSTTDGQVLSDWVHLPCVSPN